MDFQAANEGFMKRHRTIIMESRFDRPPEEIWSIFGDTERLNQAVGTPFAPYTAEDVLQADGSVIRHAHSRVGPFTFRWREGFGEWVEYRHVRQERLFDSGPIRELNFDVRLSPDGIGTHVRYEFFVRWSSVVGDILVLAGFAEKATKPVVETLERLVAESVENKESDGKKTLPMAPEAQSGDIIVRIADAVAKIDKSDYGHGLASRLATYLATANPLDLRRVRPLELAADWGEPPEQLIEVCVAAHAAGLLSMRWEIMCPRCRGGKSSTDVLSDLEREVHCDACNIDYERDFTNNVELVFSPEPWLRKLPSGDFCMMGAATTPHVKVQCDVEPGGIRNEEALLPPGRYRIRTLDAGGSSEIDFDGDAFPEVVVQDTTVEPGPPSAAGQIVMRNQDDKRRTVVVESTIWSDIALTGPKVIAAQAFRDLCPEQLLRPGDDVAIGRVAILFSDLKGSTALYEEIGDSRAYVLVREHFEFINARVRRWHGAVVKTIGDAVMASFPESVDGLSAALEIQADVAAFNAGREDAGIELKIGLHEGHCIAVTTDGVLDYFGTSINLAARLQGQSRGGEIVLSETMIKDPSVVRLLGDRMPDRESVMLSGFAVPMNCYRITEQTRPEVYAGRSCHS